MLVSVGGIGAHRWKLLEGPAALGAKLSETGVLSFQPYQEGEFVLKIQVEDASGKTAVRILNIIAQPPRFLPKTTAALSDDSSSIVLTVTYEFDHPFYLEDTSDFSSWRPVSEFEIVQGRATITLPLRESQLYFRVRF